MTTDAELFAEGLATLQDYAQAHAETAEQLRALLRYDPARMSVETLTAAAPIASAYELGHPQSIGVLNWSTVTVHVGFAGRSAIEGNGVPVPPRSWIVMPLEVNMLDLGAAADDLAAVGSAMVGLIRFDAAQPLMAGALGGVLLPPGDTIAGSARATAPIAFSTVAAVSLAPGLHEIELTTWQAATTDDGNPLNLMLAETGLLLPSSPTPVVTRLRRYRRHAVTLKVAGTNAGAGAIYCGLVTATRLV